MANSITIKKINEFQGFDPKEFCVLSSYWGYEHEWQNTEAEMVEAKKKAETVDGICIAIVQGPTGEFVLGDGSGRFVLFNAAKCCRTEAEVRAITYNTGRGPLTRYWYDKFIKYVPGSVIIC